MVHRLARNKFKKAKKHKSLKFIYRTWSSYFFFFLASSYMGHLPHPGASLWLLVNGPFPSGTDLSGFPC